VKRDSRDCGQTDLDSAAPACCQTPARVQTVLDELGKEGKAKAWKFEDFVKLRELEKEGAFK